MILPEKKERAAMRVAADELTNEEIAREAGCSLRTLDNWKTEADFVKLVQWHRDKAAATIRELPISKKTRRLSDYDDLRRRVRRAIAARGKSEFPGMPDDPEKKKLFQAQFPYLLEQWRTGLYAMNRFGEVKFDGGIVDSLLAVNKQASIEKGEWTERLQIQDEVSERAKELAKRMSPEELQQKRDELLRRRAEADRRSRTLATEPGDASPAPE